MFFTIFKSDVFKKGLDPELDPDRELDADPELDPDPNFLLWIPSPDLKGVWLRIRLKVGFCISIRI